MIKRIWCEFAKPAEVCSDFVLSILKKYNTILNYKLEYGCEDETFYQMLRKYNDNNIQVSIWATLPDEMGYWINEYNAEHFDGYVRALLQRLEERGLKIRGICIDMEPPLKDVQKIISPKNRLDAFLAYGKMLSFNLNKKRFAEAKKVLDGTADYIRSKGLEGFVVCMRHCYYDLRYNSEIMQNALEVPVFGVSWDKFNAMYYATMIREEMKKIKKVNVDYLIYHQVNLLKEVLQDKLSVSVGLTNIGKLGNEPYYQNMETFIQDIGILKACGVEDFALFSLDGILEEKKLSGYLDAIDKAEPFVPKVCHHVHRNEALVELGMLFLKPYYRLIK